MKPPPWTEDRDGFDLHDPPICDHCVIDWEVAEDVANRDKTPQDTSTEKRRDQAEDLGSSASEILRQMRHVADMDATKSPKRTSSNSSLEIGTQLENNGDPTRRARKKRKMSQEEKALEHTAQPDQILDNQSASYGRRHSPERTFNRPTHVSVFDPLNADRSFTLKKHRPLPKWMLELPSNSPMIMRSPSTPTRLPSQTLLLSGPTTLELASESDAEAVSLTRSSPDRMVVLAGVSLQTDHEQKMPVQNLKNHPERQMLPPKQISSFPFFQNPRSPLTPATESSWGQRVSRGLDPYSESFQSSDRTGPTTKSRRDTSFHSREYKDKYDIRSPDPDDGISKICPICEQEVFYAKIDDGSLKKPKQLRELSIIDGLNGHLYHASCIQCRSCRRPFASTDSMIDWTWLGSSSPYHRICLAQGAKPMLKRLKKRLNIAAIPTKQIGNQEIAPHMLPGLTRPSAAVVQRKRSSTSILTAIKRPEYLPRMPTLFSRNTGPSTAHVPIGYSPDPCISCGESLLFSESMQGPNGSIHHKRCLRACTKCRKDFEGNGTSWYVYSKDGLMRCICKDCWIEAGMDEPT